MTRLQALSNAAHAAVDDALDRGEIQRAIRLNLIATAIDRELDGTAHHPNCECNRCFSNMRDPA